MEASELIEAIRGKRGDVQEEAADVLFVLFQLLSKRDVSVEAVLQTLDEKCDNLLGQPPQKDFWKG